MVAWGVALAAVLASFVLAFVAVSYERELRAMACFLEKRECGSNERVSVDFSTRGIVGIARAINEELNAQRDARIVQEAHRAAFRQDLASLSHDIRTPLAGAQGYLQLHDRAESETERRRCLSEAASRLAAMRKLTDTLFDYSKALDESAPLALSSVRACDVLADVLAGMYPQFLERGWAPELHIEDEEVLIEANAEALARVFSNVLTNVVRYGADAPCIVQRNGVFVVKNNVSDSSSIDPARLFDRFYRADTARGGGGSGLGLAIVAQLCSRMGGSASARIEGDMLEITLAFKPASAASMA